MTNPADALDWYQRRHMQHDYKRPSADFTTEELRAEYDWLYEFQSHLAERIRGDEDVHSLADYVAKIEDENAKLRELVVALQRCQDGRCDGECPMFTPEDNIRGVPPVCEAYGVMRKLGLEDA